MSISNTSSTPKNLYPSSVRIGLMNPDIAQTWAQRVLSNGTTVASVKKGDTVNHTTSQPISNGLFCQRIFGPCTDYTCACGHEKIRIHSNVNVAPLVCPECNVEWTLSSVRRNQLGLIELLSPVTHKWFSNGRNYIPILAGITVKTFKGLKECKLFFPFALQGVKTIPDYTGGLKKFRSAQSLKSSTKATRLMKNLCCFTESLDSLKTLTQQKRTSTSVYRVNSIKLHQHQVNFKRKTTQGFYSLISTVEILQRGESFSHLKGNNIKPILQKNSTPTKIFNIENLKKPFLFENLTIPNNRLKTDLISWKVKRQAQTLSRQKEITYYNEVTASKKINSKRFNSTNIIFSPENQVLENFQPYLRGHFFRDNFQHIQALILNPAALTTIKFRKKVFGFKKFVKESKNTTRNWSVATINTNNFVFYQRGFLVLKNAVQPANHKPNTKENEVFTESYESNKKFSFFINNQSLPIRPSFTQPEDYRRQFLKFLGPTDLTKLLDIPIVRYTAKSSSGSINFHHNLDKLENSFYWDRFYGSLPLSSIISRLLGQIQEPNELTTISQKKSEKLNSTYFKTPIQPTIEIYFSETKSAAKEQTIKKILLQTGGGGLQKYLEKINLGKLIFFLQNDLIEISPLLVKSHSTRRILAFIVNKTFNDINKNYNLLEQFHKGLETNLDSNKVAVYNQVTLTNKIENLEKQYKDLKKEYKIVKKICSDFENRKNINKRRYKLAFQLFRTMSTPAGMTLSSIPVLPPGLRPIIDIPKIGPITADLNIRYRALVFALRNLRELAYVDFRNTGAAQASVQEAVDELLYTGGKSRRDKGVTNMSQNLYKSLAMRLKGKHGRFRGNLLGKRVDYSGRSVIVVGPTLKIHQCGLPFEIAIKLFNPFLIRRLIQKGLCKNVYKAKQVLIKHKFKSLIWALCREVMLEHLVLLNRAPTLHRLGVQAFMPILVSGRAILLHPLVCTGFNADFDGDQMGVHVPLFPQPRAEAWKMMWSRNNFLSPSSGEPILLPSQDMVLGCYYLTESSLVKPNKKIFFNSTQQLLKFENKFPTLNFPLSYNNRFLSPIVPFINRRGVKICPKTSVVPNLNKVKVPYGQKIKGEGAHILRFKIKNFILGKNIIAPIVNKKNGLAYGFFMKHQDQKLSLHSNFRASESTLHSLRGRSDTKSIIGASQLQMLFYSSNVTPVSNNYPKVNSFLPLTLGKGNICDSSYKNLELVLRQKIFFNRGQHCNRKATLLLLIYLLIGNSQTTNSLDINFLLKSSLLSAETSLKNWHINIKVNKCDKNLSFSECQSFTFKLNKVGGVPINLKLFSTAFINYLLVDKSFWSLTYLNNKVKYLPWIQRFDFTKRKQDFCLSINGLGTKYESKTNQRQGSKASIYGFRSYKTKKNKLRAKMVKIPPRVNLAKHQPEVLSVKTVLEKYTRGFFNLQSTVWVKSNTTIKKTEGGGTGSKIPSLELRVTPYGVSHLLQVSEIKKTFFHKSTLLPSKRKNKSPFQLYSVRTTIGRLLFNDVLKKFDTF